MIIVLHFYRHNDNIKQNMIKLRTFSVSYEDISNAYFYFSDTHFVHLNFTLLGNRMSDSLYNRH